MKKYLLFIITIFSLIGCENLIEPYPYGNIDDEEMGKFQNYVSGLIGFAYEQMPRHYRDIQGNRLDCLTDDAVLTNVNDAVAKMAIGVTNNAHDPFSGIWTSSYKAIANINLFLKDDFGINTKYYLNPDLDKEYKKLLLGEAYGMRAMMEWRLLKYYGGKGLNSHEFLGFPIITERMTIESKNIDLPRDSYEKCVAQILSDCEEAYKLLPIAHRDWLYDSDFLLKFDKVVGSANWGRIDGLTTRAILADMYLTYASPLFNPNNDRERWKKAAQYAKEVIDFKLNIDGQHGFNPYSGLNWFDACSPSSVFVSRRDGDSDRTDGHEREFYPNGFRGNGTLGATQDLVDAFPMKNGYPKDHPEGQKLYDPEHPYNNRDPRLYSIIFYPGSKNKAGYTFETWFDEASGKYAKDAPGLTKVSRTGYHIRKMVFPNLNWSASTVVRAAHVKHYYRWEHMILAFAEAANEYEGPNGNSFGLSAKDALKYLRQRKTYDGVVPAYASNDQYLEDAAKDPQKFRELIRNERRIELCFEGQRFFDIRRWAKSLDEINKPVHKIEVTKKADGEMVYKNSVLEERKFSSLYIPIPYNEILKANKIEQNEGWNAWSK